MTSTVTRASGLRAALANARTDRRTLRAVGAANALAARVGAEHGFDALWVSGLEVSAALGLPDENVLGPGDLAAVVQAVGRVSALPVIVDVDNAGGSVATAHRFAGDLAPAGAAALCLEDSAYPKVNSFALHRTQQLTGIGLMGEQLDAMRRAGGPDLLLIARTEALICGAGLEHALDRARIFVESGADAVLIHSKDTTGREALALAAAWAGPAPLVTVPTAFPHLTLDQLAEAGFTLAIYANQLSRAALSAMRTAAGSFAETGSFTATGTPLAGVQDLLQVADPLASACV